MYKVGHAAWIEYWKQRTAAAPLVAELRVDVKSITEISYDEDTFKTRFLLNVRIPRAALYSPAFERKLEPGAAYVMADGDKIEEFWPWLEFDGTVLSKWSWARDRGEYMTFSYEVEGKFNTKNAQTGAFFPFDYHSLPVRISSNWDSKHLLFAPFGSSSSEAASATLTTPVSVVDPECCRFRNSLQHGTLEHVWRSSKVPRLTMSSTDGFTGSKCYSEAEVSIFVHRRIGYHSTYEFVRPLALALLCPVSLSFLDEVDERLNYNVNLIVGMSFAFLAVRSKRITLADMYRASLLLYASLILVLAIDPDGELFIFSLGAWGLLGIIHAGFALRLAAAYPARWREWTAHRDIRDNSLEHMLHSLRSVVTKRGGKGRGANKKHQHLAPRAFTDDDE